MLKFLNRAGFWSLQATILATLFAWATLDPAFDLMAYRLKAGMLSPVAAVQDSIDYVGASRIILLLALLGVALATLVWRFASFFISFLISFNSGPVSRTKYASLRSLLGLLTLTGIWCGLAVNYVNVSMQAKGIRVAWQIGELERLVEPLRSQWPRYDGATSEVGPFMAYPVGRPATLILLTPPSIAGGRFTISTIERGDHGQIRLLLGSQSSGTDYGDWVEWHPEGSVPTSFVGGLHDYYALRSSVSLGSGWYLVRYQA